MKDSAHRGTSRQIYPCIALALLIFTFDVSAAEKLIGLHSAIAVSQSLPWIARESGIFKKNNLDFELVYIQSAGAATAAMIGGDAEVGILGVVGIARAYIQGAQDFAIIGTIKNILTHSIVAGPEIKRPQDLKGKIIGVTRIGSNSHYFALQALPRFGLDLKDVTFRQTGGDIAGLAALSNGTVHAMAILTYGQSAIAQGFHYVIYGPDLRIPYAAASLTTRRSVLTRRPQVVGAYMRSLAEAAKVFHTDKEYTFKILSKYLRIGDRKILEDSYNAEAPALEARLGIRSEAIQAVLDEIAQSDPRASNVKPQQLIDRRYLEDMDRSGFMENLWAQKNR